MTEFLSMTLLSAEPVSAAKPQAAQSVDGATEPDQSFAATLAAEVNGKSPEKATKATVKSRQNTASEAADTKEQATAQAATVPDEKNNSTSTVASNTSEQQDEEPALSATPDTAPEQNEKAETGQSEWLNLLDKAKSLQERLTKAEEAHTAAQDKAGSAADKLAAQAGTAAQQQDKTKATDSPAAEPDPSAKSKVSVAQSEAIVLDEKLMAEPGSEQHLTPEELKALKLITQADKTAGTKQMETGLLKQKMAAEAGQTESETATEEVVEKSLLTIKKDTGPDQSKIIAHIEKPLKAAGQTGQKEQKELIISPTGTEKLVPDETQAQSVTTINGKVPVPSEQITSLIKVSTAPTDKDSAVDIDVDAETPDTPAGAADPKVSVQSQSAALVAPAAQSAKASSSDVKVTTEEALKQIQTADAQGEQGTSSSAGEQSQQGSADTMQSVMEQQNQHKNGAGVAADASSFSNQLKSNLEKAASGLSVAGRDLVAESGSKQVDQLGQKLNLIQPEASNQLKEKMLMMVQDKVHTAEIRLDPSELGSMQIKISLQQDQMSVQFMVQQGNAKDLMEQQMPKLKELLQQQGIELSQGSVQQQNQSSSGQEGGRRSAGGTGSGSVLDGSDELIEPAMIPTKNADRVVDYYA